MEKNYQNFAGNLSKIKSTLASDGAKECIDKIKDYLPDYSPKYDLLILLATSYNEIRQDQIKAVLTKDEENRLLNKLTDRVLNFLNQLTEADFTKPADNEESTDPRIGKVKYSIPQKMQLNEETECCVWIAFDEETILKETGETEGEVKDIRVSNVMGVEMLCHKKGDAFNIESYDDTEQLIEKNLATNWAFYVTPLLEGKYPLILRISIIIAVNGEKINKTKVLREVIQISAEKPEIKEGELVEKEAQGLFLMATGGAGAGTKSAMEGTSKPPPAPIGTNAASKAKTVAKTTKKISGKMGAMVGVLGIALASLLVFNNGNVDDMGGGGSSGGLTTLSWEDVKDSKDPSEIEDFIKENPDSEFEDEATDLLADLQEDKEVNSEETKVDEENPQNNPTKDASEIPEKPKNEITKPTKKNDEKKTDIPSNKTESPVTKEPTETPDDQPVKFKNAARKPIYSSCQKERKQNQKDCTPNEIREFVFKGLRKSYKKLDGQARVNFVIDKDGNVVDVNVISTDNDKLADKTVEIIKKMPQFLPGQDSNGDAVRVLYELPVRYKGQ